MLAENDYAQSSLRDKYLFLIGIFVYEISIVGNYIAMSYRKS